MQCFFITGLVLTKITFNKRNTNPTTKMSTKYDINFDFVI